MAVGSVTFTMILLHAISELMSCTLCLQPQCKIHIGKFSIGCSTSYCTGILALLVVRLSVVDCSTMGAWSDFQSWTPCYFTGTSTMGAWSGFQSWTVALWVHGQTFSCGHPVILQVQVLWVQGQTFSLHTIYMYIIYKEAIKSINFYTSHAPWDFQLLIL